MSNGKNIEIKISKGKNVENKNIERLSMRIEKKNLMLYCYEHDSLINC